MKKSALFALLLFITFSCNKSEDPQPTNTTSNPNNPTNSAPQFTSTSTTIVSDGTSKTVTLSLSDADNDIVTITNITGSSSYINVSDISGKDFKITPNNKVYAGTETLSIAISDGTATTTSIFTLKVGDDNQITTYNTISPFFGLVLNGSAAGTFVIKSDGTITSNTSPSFYGDASSSATYKIIGSSIEITSAGGTVKTYQVSPRTVGSAGFNMGSYEVHKSSSTYDSLSPYFSKTLDGNFRITSTTISGGNDFDFYESSATSASYTILSNDNILMSVNGVNIEYSVQYPDANHLQFTLVSTTNSSYSQYVGTTFLF